MYLSISQEVIISLGIPISEEHFFLGFPGQKLDCAARSSEEWGHKQTNLLGIPVSEEHS